MSSAATARRTLAFGRDPEVSATLPGNYYFDSGIYEREKEAIWSKSWLFVGYARDVERQGSYITATLFDQPVVAVRGKDGVLRSFYNVCMHRGHTLLEGKGQRAIITCPFHAWSYDLEGSLKAAGNAENVAGFEHRDFSLTPIKVDTFLHMVFVNFDPAARSIADTYAGFTADVRRTIPGFDRLKLASSDPLPGKYNWKFFPDMNECYHCPVLHTIMGEQQGAYLQNSWVSEEHGRWAKHIILGKSDLGPDERPYSFGTEAIQDVNIWYMWPNLIFIAHQGSPNFKIQATWPTGPETTHQVLDVWCLNDPPDEADLGHIRNYRDRIMPEDITAMEKQQLGVHCRGYKQGRLMVDVARSWRSEHGTHHFQRMVWEALNGVNY
ncbi:MAG: aromatic ring-hydroxylating dioxygenase subunit alpha [Alphaproteobacteria bacterium]|nr:aromatic ring-hydroxylating dioxygenase subunit alpha [Alphaproteobacteria bacterium]